jgi:hypothetical protein
LDNWREVPRYAKIGIPVVAMVIFNWVPDYFSYMKTRLILKKISKMQGAPGLVAFAFIDTGLTLMIFVLALEVVAYSIGGHF